MIKFLKFIVKTLVVIAGLILLLNLALGTMASRYVTNQLNQKSETQTEERDFQIEKVKINPLFTRVVLNNILIKNSNTSDFQMSIKEVNAKLNPLEIARLLIDKENRTIVNFHVVIKYLDGSKTAETPGLFVRDMRIHYKGLFSMADLMNLGSGSFTRDSAANNPEDAFFFEVVARELKIDPNEEDHHILSILYDINYAQLQIQPLAEAQSFHLSSTRLEGKDCKGFFDTKVYIDSVDLGKSKFLEGIIEMELTDPQIAKSLESQLIERGKPYTVENGRYSIPLEGPIFQFDSDK